MLELEALPDLFAKSAVEHGDSAPAPRLRLEHRHVGVLQQARGIGRTVLEEHDPDARGDRECSTGRKTHRLGEPGAELFGTL